MSDLEIFKKTAVLIDSVKKLIANFPPDVDDKARKYWKQVLGKLELITYEGTKQ